MLQAEVHYSPSTAPDGSARTMALRHAKRYPPPESPLVEVGWHRVVYDEAQMVGAGLGAVATMAARISASYRWAVTGTPSEWGTR